MDPGVGPGVGPGVVTSVVVGGAKIRSHIGVINNNGLNTRCILGRYNDNTCTYIMA